MPRYVHRQRPSAASAAVLDKREAKPNNSYSNTRLVLLFVALALVAYVHEIFKNRPQLLKELKQGNLAILWASGPPKAVSPDPLRHPVEDYVAEIHSYFLEEKFDVLDQIVAQLRARKDRFPGGEWKLKAFYQGLRSAAGEARGNLGRLSKWAKEHPVSMTPMVAMVDNLVMVRQHMDNRYI